jgi:tetratricopeptide (TPR) repeat protein
MAAIRPARSEDGSLLEQKILKLRWLLLHRGFWACWGLMLMAAAAPAFAAQTPPSVILISIDTLRADHLSAYGYRKLRTPQIDSYAQGGTLFTQVESQIPLTLPSHTSLFSSTYPFENGIEENDEHVPSGLVTLAWVLKERGYRTGAFIGGYFLDRSFGLDRGFDVYDSPFQFRNGRPPNALALRRDGVWVIRAARLWLASNSAHPVFCFVHLFDLHRPYALESKPGLSGYDAELAYEDQLLGNFKQFLIQSGWWKRSLVVVLSDHGEGLGDHNEITHGYFIYQSTLHVPLIFHWPEGAPKFRAQVPQPAGLIDVAPTLLDFLGIPLPASFQGHSLLEEIRSGGASAPEAIYSESVYAHDAFGWAALRGLRWGDDYYIQAPHPELYNLKKDPGELHNLYAQDRALAQTLADRLAELRARYAARPQKTPANLSRQELARLESLGYVTAGPAGISSRAGPEPDPKDRLLEYRIFERALLALQDGRLGDAIPSFEEILRRDPRNTLARFHLGEAYLAARRPYDAVREWRSTLHQNPAYTPAAQSLGEFWMSRGDYPRARARLEQALAAAPENSRILLELGIVEDQVGEKKKALEHVEAACKLGPSSECQRILTRLKQKAR